MALYELEICRRLRQIECIIIQETMKISIPISTETQLFISNDLPETLEYPTSQLQKGLLLIHKGENLAEEAVGFGVPVIKKKIQTIFSGDADLFLEEHGSNWKITALYKMNMQERIADRKSGRFYQNSVFSLKNLLSFLHIHFPSLRSVLDKTSTFIRTIFNLETCYESFDDFSLVKATYSGMINSPLINILFEFPDHSSQGVTEVILMNEQGAHFFDTFIDNNGTHLSNKQIGSWSKVVSKSASFICKKYDLSFSLACNGGSETYRGYEDIESRLAWAGFGISIAPTEKIYQYQIDLGKIK
jgi:hypothetical protein